MEARLAEAQARPDAVARIVGRAFQRPDHTGRMSQLETECGVYADATSDDRLRRATCATLRG